MSTSMVFPCNSCRRTMLLLLGFPCNKKRLVIIVGVVLLLSQVFPVFTISPCKDLQCSYDWLWWRQYQQHLSLPGTSHSDLPAVSFHKNANSFFDIISRTNWILHSTAASKIDFLVRSTVSADLIWGLSSLSILSQHSLVK